MKSCGKCGKPVTNLFMNAKSDGWHCRDCYDAPPMRYDPSVRIPHADGKGSISVGHLNDIRARRLAPDGSVYRDTGRRTI